MAELLSLADAQSRLFALIDLLPCETVPLIEAAGRWAARPLTAKRTQPFADLSAMDGYAIRHADLPGPWRVIGESAAGSAAPAPLGTGEAMRIFTGAPLPPGADCILIQEEAAREGDRLLLAGEGPGRPSKHVRARGTDFLEDAEIIATGQLFTPARLALAAVAGHGEVTVRQRARVSLISTGDELVPAGAIADGHRLPSSNAPMLATLLAGPGAQVTDLGIAPDRLDAIVAHIEAARDADLIITSGGASVGDHDLVKPAFEAAGARLDFWKVAMRPGKPLMAGRLGDSLVLGLPGNPVSAFVTAKLFAAPLIAALGGAADPLPQTRLAPLGAPLPANGSRTHFLRGRWREGQVVADQDQDSAGLARLAAAELLIARSAGAGAGAIGDMVEILDLRG